MTSLKPTSRRDYKPLTLRILHDACSAFGGSVDDALEDPQRLFDEISLDGASDFVEAVLEDPPKLDEMPLAQAHEVIAEVAGGFFFDHLTRSIARADRGMAPIWKRAGVPDTGGGSISFMRSMAHARFGDYQKLMDARLEDTLVYLSLRAINAAHEKD